MKKKNGNTFFFFLFMEGCPEAESAKYLLSVITRYYRGRLHDASSKKHNIEHTKIICDEVFKDGCILVKKWIDLARNPQDVQDTFDRHKFSHYDLMSSKKG
jgi:hypothetical protein